MFVQLIVGVFVCSSYSPPLVLSDQCVCPNRTWPPTNINQLKDRETGVFDIRLNPVTNAESLRSDSLRDYVDKLSQQYNGAKLSGSLFYQAVTMHQKNGGFGGLGEYDYYPQPVDHFRILKEVREGVPVYEAPKYDFPLKVVHTPSTCEYASNKYDIVFLIQSCVQCAEARQRGRQTYLKGNLWPQMTIGYAFVLGKPAAESVKEMQIDDLKFKQPPSYPADTNRTQLWESLVAESMQYRDMLIGDFEDGMFNYTLNYILATRWASAFCSSGTPLFALVDGRYSIFPDNFAKWLKKIPDSDKARMYGGYVLNRTVDRDQVSLQEYPHSSYPQLVNAGFIVLGRETVQESAILTAFTQYLRNVGGYVATVNRKLRINPIKIDGVYVDIPDSKSAKSALAGMAATADQYIDWATGIVK